MAIWTYVKNSDPNSKVNAILLRNGTLVLKLGQYTELTAEEVNDCFEAGAYLEEGIKEPSNPANPGSSSSVLTVVPWTAKTYILANTLVSHEGELLRTLKNFTTGTTYEF